MHSVERTPPSVPKRANAAQGMLDDCLEACARCELACVACAEACLDEVPIEGLFACIRLTRSCAESCDLSARLLARGLLGDTDFLRAQLEACARICASCGAECMRHASRHEPCRIAAEVCRRCEERCRETRLGLRGYRVSKLDEVS